MRRSALSVSVRTARMTNFTSSRYAQKTVSTTPSIRPTADGVYGSLVQVPLKFIKSKGNTQARRLVIRPSTCLQHGMRTVNWKWILRLSLEFRLPQLPITVFIPQNAHVPQTYMLRRFRVPVLVWATGHFDRPDAP